MREIPECLNRRYQILDKLIKDLSTSPPPGESAVPQPSAASNEVGVKLMCDFWNILKEDPECDLPREVQQRLCDKSCVGMYGPQRLDCYLACRSTSKDNLHRNKRTCGAHKEGTIKSSRPQNCQHECEKLPLTQVLNNIKEAASFDKKCHVRVEELMSTQRDLMVQIQNLEKREKQGVQLLKQADCMWSCMEESYKKKISQSQERYKALMTELKEIETSAIKWKKHKKDLEFQLTNINQCGDDIKEKTYQKNNDLKVMNMEIEELKKRIASNAKDLNVAKNSYKAKKEASDARMATMASNMKSLQQKVAAENKIKKDKEIEGTKYVKEAREDLQKICRVLLQKKLENEDLRAEKDAILQEIDLLKQTFNNCKQKCGNKEKSITEELTKVENDLAEMRIKCTKCHECTDTMDIRKYCTDCPRCLTERHCLYSEDHCSNDYSMDCVCMSVKQKFLDNVFDNMYTVLERQSKTCPGKAVADCVLNCLKRSRNGKLNQETRKVLQDFILSTVKKNLNLTIVGGAVKTRCEMDPETYKQLMLCLKDVTVTRPVKEDKGTGSKKEPCHRWGGISECHCPKGPKACVCSKAPHPPTDPPSCGLQPAEEDPAEKSCPQRESLACSTDCGMLGMPGAPSNWRREPCAGQSCPFSKNMRAAQCVLGPEPLSSEPKAHSLPPNTPKKLPEDKTVKKLAEDKTVKKLPEDKTVKKLPEDKMATCACGSKAVKPCPCNRDIKQLTAEVTDTCNQGTCANFRKIKKGTQTLEFSQKEESGTTQGIKMNISENENKEQFMISIEDKSGLASHQFTELKQTKSGRLAMELDEQLIDMIEKKSQENPSLFVSIKNTSSGNLLVDFNTKENETDNTHKVTIRRTSSGTRLLDIHKNVINILKGSLYNKSADTHISKSIKLAMSPKKQDSLIQVVGSNKADVNTLQLHDINSEKHIIQHKAENKGERERDKNSCKDIISPSSNSQLKSINELPLPADSATKSSLGKELQRTDNLDRQKLPRLQQSSNTFDLKSQFKKLYKKGNADVEVHIKEKDGVVQTFSTVVTKTTSGTIAIYVDNKTSLKYTHVIKNEHPVLLSKITSREYFVNLDRKGRVFNAIIRKTPSEGMLIIPESRSFIEIHSQSHKSGYNIKLTIIGLQTPHALELPAILRTTSSLNYEIVLNKNIESKEKDHVNEFMENKKETTVNLHKTSSGNYIIDLDTENESHLTKQKALINKSSSGDMKVIIQKDVFESIVDLVSLESLSNDYSQPVGKLPASSREIHRENLRKLKKMDKKTSNNSQVNKNSKDHDNKKIFSKKTGVVKMTKSGQYAVMLDEETKKAFMKNLQSFLSTNSDGLIPIKRSDSGEIIINLNCGNKSKEHYGTLKITPSGNIYVVVDEEVIKTMTGRAKNKKLTDDADVGTRSQHITNIIASVNKAITTTCNGQPDDCDCDAAKCVCSELQLDTFDWSSDFKPKKIKPSIWTKANRKAGSFHLKKRSVVAKSSSKSKPAHIVIKPICDCRPKSKKSTSKKHCCFLIDSVCPYHQNRYDSVSNEILEITGLCNSHKDPSKNKIEFEAINNLPTEEKGPQVWDSLNYLPPQLPPFLNFDYR